MPLSQWVREVTLCAIGLVQNANFCLRAPLVGRIGGSPSGDCCNPSEGWSTPRYVREHGTKKLGFSQFPDYGVLHQLLDRRHIGSFHEKASQSTQILQGREVVHPNRKSPLDCIQCSVVASPLAVHNSPHRTDLGAIVALATNSFGYLPNHVEV